MEYLLRSSTGNGVVKKLTDHIDQTYRRSDYCGMLFKLRESSKLVDVWKWDQELAVNRTREEWDDLHVYASRGTGDISRGYGGTCCEPFGNGPQLMCRAAQFQIWRVRNIDLCPPCRQVPLGLLQFPWTCMIIMILQLGPSIGFYDISFLIIDMEIDIRDMQYCSPDSLAERLSPKRIPGSVAT